MEDGVFLLLIIVKQRKAVEGRARIIGESELAGDGGDSYREFAGEAGTGRRLRPDGQPLKASMYCLRRLAKAATRADAVSERGFAHLGDSAACAEPRRGNGQGSVVAMATSVGYTPTARP